jgi:hypothetical protein
MNRAVLYVGIAVLIIVNPLLVNAGNTGLSTDKLGFTYPGNGSRGPMAQAALSPIANVYKNPETTSSAVILNFNNLPAAIWKIWQCAGAKGNKADIAHGILTLSTPSCYEFYLNHGAGLWHQSVSNARGWVIEANLKMGADTVAQCDDRGAVQIWAHDHSQLVILGFSTHEICLAYPSQIHFAMDTTKNFHVYRMEAQGKRLRIYVDGKLAIDHTITNQPNNGTDLLMFGDGVGSNKSVSYWDYFAYDVDPKFGNGHFAKKR